MHFTLVLYSKILIFMYNEMFEQPWESRRADDASERI